MDRIDGSSRVECLGSWEEDGERARVGVMMVGSEDDDDEHRW